MKKHLVDANTYVESGKTLCGIFRATLDPRAETMSPRKATCQKCRKAHERNKHEKP